jgi:hypothetical protein
VTPSQPKERYERRRVLTSNGTEKYEQRGKLQVLPRNFISNQFANPELEINNSEYKLFKTKQRVTDESGVSRGETRGADIDFDQTLQRKAQTLDVRNGVGEYAPGDKPYANPVCSPGYYAVKSIEPRLCVSAFDPKRTKADKSLLEAIK